MAESIIIGITGPVGSGSTTAAKHLRDNYQFTHLQLSSPIKRLWHLAHGEHERPRRFDLQRLGDRLRRRTHNGVVAELALRHFQDNHPVKIVIDGIRNVGEVDYLRERFGYHFTLLAVLTSFESRWDRISAKYTDFGLTIDDFGDDDERDRNEETPHGQQVELCVDRADFLIDNGDQVPLRKFKRKVTAFHDLLTGQNPRPATESEILMNMALSASHSSKCSKRHVGAVIVDVRGQIVGVGYNENPFTTKACVEEPEYNNQCYRDFLRNRHFNDLADRGVRCPKCGEPLTRQVGPPWRCQMCKSRKQKLNLEAFFFPDRAMNWCTAIHAEMNAIFSAGERAREGTLYTTTFPCFQCAEKLTQAGIKVVYFTEAYSDPHSGRRLELSGVELRQFEGVRSGSFDRIFSRNKPT